MLIDKTLIIKLTNKNITHYRKLGYNNKSGDIVEIKTEDMPASSKYKVRVQCDGCQTENIIIYHSYTRNCKNGIYLCKKCSHIRFEETCLEKYNVRHPMQNQEIKDKAIQTNLTKYGVKYVGQNLDIKKKIENTCIEKYGEKSYMLTDEFRNISIDKMREKYGVSYPSQSKEIREKIENTCINVYGFKTPLMSNVVKEKIISTKKIKYGDINYNNRNKYKSTCLEIFGYDNPMKNIFIQDKVKKSMISRYGVEYAAQIEEFYNKMIKNGYLVHKYEDIYYQGEYELDFLQKYYHIGIQRGPTIEYVFNNTEHFYYSDFYFDKLNLIIEIKSKRWYDEHLEKNKAKERACIDQGYNFIIIIDKDYSIFEKIVKHIIYDKQHCWQYDVKLKLSNENNKYKNLEVKNFTFEYISDSDKKGCEEIKEFIEKYEWLGKMPNRPTHRFVAKYNDEIGAAVIMATPNSFSKLIDDEYDNLEKLISRGANAPWTPKNLSSSLIMWAIKWMVKNTDFRLFTAYSDTEAKELGTIYQACNFIYLGQKYGGEYLYFDLNKSHLGWFSNRNFRRRNIYNKMAKKLNIIVSWKKVSDIPKEVKKILDDEISKYKKYCIERKTQPKHKYLYILGKDKRETKFLIRKFQNKNPKLIRLNYPKNR